MLPDPLPLGAYGVYGAGGILFRQTPSVNVLLQLSYGQIAGLSREVHPGQGVAAGEEPQPQIRLEIGLGGSLLQAGPQLVQERRPFAVGHDLELGGDRSVHELTPTPRSGLVGSGRRGEGKFYFGREGGWIQHFRPPHVGYRGALVEVAAAGEEQEAGGDGGLRSRARDRPPVY